MKTISIKGKLEGKFRFDNMARIYDRKVCCPTVNCYGGGEREPKVIKAWKSESGKQQNKAISK